MAGNRPIRNMPKVFSELQRNRREKAVPSVGWGVWRVGSKAKNPSTTHTTETEAHRQAKYMTEYNKRPFEARLLQKEEGKFMSKYDEFREHLAKAFGLELEKASGDIPGGGWKPDEKFVGYHRHGGTKLHFHSGSSGKDVDGVTFVGKYPKPGSFTYNPKPHAHPAGIDHRERKPPKLEKAFEPWHGYHTHNVGIERNVIHHHAVGEGGYHHTSGGVRHQHHEPRDKDYVKLPTPMPSTQAGLPRMKDTREIEKADPSIHRHDRYGLHWHTSEHGVKALPLGRGEGRYMPPSLQAKRERILRHEHMEKAVSDKGEPKRKEHIEWYVPLEKAAPQLEKGKRPKVFNGWHTHGEGDAAGEHYHSQVGAGHYSDSQKGLGRSIMGLKPGTHDRPTSPIKHRHVFDPKVDYSPGTGTYRTVRKALAKMYDELEKAVTVNTNRFEGSHGRKPRGKGMWAFNVGGKQHTFTDHYTGAVRQAKRVARQGGHGTVHVLP